MTRLKWPVLIGLLIAGGYYLFSLGDQVGPPDSPVPPLPEPPGPPRVRPGDRVQWTDCPAVRKPPIGVGLFLADIESHLPPSAGNQYRSADRITWCHETTHGVHAALRQQHRLPTLYPGGGRCAVCEHPKVVIRDVAALIPARFRGSRYHLYLVSQAGDWNKEPLYLWDEWVAYDNGMTTGTEERRRQGLLAWFFPRRFRPIRAVSYLTGSSDDAVACIEFSGYALGVAAACRQKGMPLTEQSKEFLAWELRRSLALYQKAVSMPPFAWPDRKLEALWRANDPYLADELKALYGESLTTKDLLP